MPSKLGKPDDLAKAIRSETRQPHGQHPSMWHPGQQWRLPSVVTGQLDHCSKRDCLPHSRNLCVLCSDCAVMATQPRLVVALHVAMGDSFCGQSLLSTFGSAADVEERCKHAVDQKLIDVKTATDERIVEGDAQLHEVFHDRLNEQHPTDLL